MSKTRDEQRLIAGRISVGIALALATIGLLRFVTDTLHEVNHDYWRALEGTPLRYLVRAPSDGTLLGWLNAQWFKLLSIPSGMALWWLFVRFGSGTWESMREQLRDYAIRSVWIGSCLAGFTLIELEKQFHMLGMATLLLEGELPWLNHLAHLLSAALAWWLLDRLRIEPIWRSEIELERELDELSRQPVDEPGLEPVDTDEILAAAE